MSPRGAAGPAPVDQELVARFRRAGGRAGAVVSAVGALALLGWALHWPALRSVLPGKVTMKPNTALCLALAGMGL